MGRERAGGGTWLRRPGRTASCTVLQPRRRRLPAQVNNRKKKVIAAYELDLRLGWEGAAADGTLVQGEVRLPYISEEQDDGEAQEVQGAQQ